MRSSDGAVAAATFEPPHCTHGEDLLGCQAQAYYWYKKVKEECERELGDKCAMGGYTRLLHR